MQAGEVVTDIYFDFGTVPVGFQSVANPTLSVMVKGMAVNGYQMVNRADAGGKYQGTWQTATANWVTIIRKIGTTPETAQDGILTTERRQPAFYAGCRLLYTNYASIIVQKSTLMSTVVRTRWLSLLQDSQN